MKNNEITIFNNKLFGSVRTLKLNEKIYFVGKDIAEALGYKNTRDAILRHCKGVVKHDVLDITGAEQQMNIIPESDVYRLIFGSHLPEAEKFEEWVMEEVLPTLRRSGVVITESATQEAINYESKFGTRRIRKTFRETTNLIETWNEFKTLSKIERDARRINNDVRIKGCGIIVDELQDYLANNVAEMKTYEVVMYQEIIQEILAEKNRLSNKYYGGLLSAQTKTIKKLEQRVEELAPNNLVFTTIDIHPFTMNCMYQADAQGRQHRSEAYNKWINKFPAHQVPTLEEYAEYESIDFTKPIGIEIRYICKDGFDVDNLNKATIDMIFNRIFRIDDNIVQEVKATKVDTCNTYNQGKIIFAIYNI